MNEEEGALGPDLKQELRAHAAALEMMVQGLRQLLDGDAPSHQEVASDLNRLESMAGAMKKTLKDGLLTLGRGRVASRKAKNRRGPKVLRQQPDSGEKGRNTGDKPPPITDEVRKRIWDIAYELVWAVELGDEPATHPEKFFVSRYDHAPSKDELKLFLMMWEKMPLI